jgi:hypothetical protein
MPNASNAYATINPIKANIGDTIQGIEKMDFAYREEEQRAEAVKAAAQKAKDDRRKELTKDYQLASPDATGVQSIEQANITLIKDAIEKLAPLKAKELSGQELSTEEIILRDKLLNLPKTLSLMGKSFADRQNTYAEHLKAGGHADLKYEQITSAMPTNAKAFIDKNGDAVIGIDADGNGELEFIHSSYEDLSINPRLVKNINLQTAIKEAAANIEPNRTVTDKNFVKKTDEYVPLNVAKAQATNMLYKQDGTLSDLVLSQFYPLTEDKIPKEKLTAFENELATALQNSKKRIDETDKDYGSQTSRMTENRTARKQKEEDGDTEFGKNNISHSGFVIKDNGKGFYAGQKGGRTYALKDGSLQVPYGEKGYDNVTAIVVKNGIVSFKVERHDGEVTEKEAGNDKTIRADGKELTTKRSRTTTLYYRSNKDLDDLDRFVTSKTKPGTNENYKNFKEFQEEVFGIKANKPAPSTKNNKPNSGVKWK